MNRFEEKILPDRPRDRLSLPHGTGRREDGFKPGNKRPSKPKAWSHQDDLKNAIGKQIAIHFADNERHAYRLVAADQFTIKVRSLAENDKSLMTFFKGQMFGYSIED